MPRQIRRDRCWKGTFPQRNPTRAFPNAGKRFCDTCSWVQCFEVMTSATGSVLRAARLEHIDGRRYVADKKCSNFNISVITPSFHVSRGEYVMPGGRFGGPEDREGRWAPWRHRKTHRFFDGDIAPNRKGQPAVRVSRVGGPISVPFQHSWSFLRPTGGCHLHYG